MTRDARPIATLALLGAVAVGLSACASDTAVQSTVALSHPPGVRAVAGEASASGEASLRQLGDRVTGSVSVRGLLPGSRHAWSIQGPFGGCAPIDQPANTTLVLHDLQANGEGVAATRLNVAVHAPLASGGYDIAVFSGPQPPRTVAQKSNPMVLCGDIRRASR